jgi:sugar lactone lactonase YvrE
VLAGKVGGPGDRNADGQTARFDAPLGLALSSAGLYVADSVTNTIRLYDLTTAVVTTIAGSPGDAGFLNGAGGSSTFDTPSALAFDVDAGILYVADTTSCAIRRVDLATSTVSTIAGKPPTCGSTDGIGSAALFNQPQGLAFGADGLFVADTGNDTIRLITMDGGIGTVVTIAGRVGVSSELNDAGTAATFSSPRALALDGQGNLYIADADAGGIRKMVIAGAELSTLLSRQTAIDAGLTGLNGLAYGGAPGTMFVTGNDAIWFTDGGVVAQVAGTPGSGGSSDFLGHFTSPGELINVVASGRLLVADTGNDAIRQIELADGGVTTIAGTAPHAGVSEDAGILADFDAPGGIATDGINLYVADTGSNTIRQITLDGGIVTTLAGVAFLPGSTNGVGPLALFNHPTGLLCDGLGNVYVADTGNETIRQIDLDGGDVTTVAGMVGVAGDAGGSPLAATFSGPISLALSTVTGFLYVADSKSGSIRQIVYTAGGPLGTVSTLAEQNGHSPLVTPSGIAIADGYVLFADEGSNTVNVIFNGGVKSMVGTPGVAGWQDGMVSVGGALTTLLSHPQGLIYVAPNAFYIADQGNSAVRLLSFDFSNPLGGGVLSTLVGTPGQSGVLTGPLPAGLNGPMGLAYTATPIPTLFISDTTENVIMQAQ